MSNSTIELARHRSLATNLPPLSPGLSTQPPLLVTMFENSLRHTDTTNASLLVGSARTSIDTTATSGSATSTSSSSVARPAQPTTPLRTVEEVLEWLYSPLREGETEEIPSSWDIFQSVVDIMSTGPHLKVEFVNDKIQKFAGGEIHEAPVRYWLSPSRGTTTINVDYQLRAEGKRVNADNIEQSRDPNVTVR
ncbi:hypothetical protein BC629DRAFT_291776 [Irpex lacteus]|nr:hypothetical protein BC629DRAFT_291776 [Irpex lacteus]